MRRVASSRERYQIDLANLQEMANNYMNKKVIRLTESDLHRIIENSVKKYINEIGRFESDIDADGIYGYGGKAIKESFQNNQNYTHFAVSKKSGKILNGWDYSEYDPSELRQFKKDYFDVDMQDYGFDPKSYKIVTGKYLLRQGVDPDDNSNWANNDEANADWIG